ncbi:UDP-glucose 4-epimerase GalE [Mucisphaera calidilacus]|uniref:UDP-glucose 4-epimerase n=1 Tax=Mucisphaera calidilacus TaxID=2527982 RepID=A0A518BZC1_9BACT|nr:UDP-glucose 4-epimerase GalE [Mucisphaera calidilacus]QDU72318.1 UDP-glucose 4-epimerase [Mucisphaera calidilacus]
MNVLVTGGAGYIGSHAVKRLREDGHTVVVLDNLYRGHRAAVPDDVHLAEIDLRDTDAIERLLREHRVEVVMNFAALAYVGESVTQPLDYYENNTAGVLSLLQAMKRAGVKRIVHSSTCATYGEPETVPMTEDLPQSPINPYGWSKLFVERMLIDFAHTTEDFAFAALRYFNVAGSARDGSIGEDHEPETHLIPVMLLTALGQREKMTIFGTDYPTPDGTCIRDYIHVEDLIDAHVTVMNALQPGDGRFYNLGIGNGLSVKQLIDAAKAVTGVDFKVEIGPRREGDPPMLYADPSKIERELGWKAKITDVNEMIASAWTWFKDHPDGYNDV